MKWQYRRCGELSYLYSQYTIISSRTVARKGKATDWMVMFKEKLLKDFKENAEGQLLRDKKTLPVNKKVENPKMKKKCDDAFRWSMPNTPAGQPEMLCTTVNIGSRWWDEHFRLNLFQYSPISFSFASHFEIFSRFKPWWTFIRFHFSKKQILFSLLSHFWSRYHFRLFLLSFFLHSRAGGRATLIYSVGRGGPTAFFL